MSTIRERVKAALKVNPSFNYAELQKWCAENFPGEPVARSSFYNMRAELIRKGEVPDTNSSEPETVISGENSNAEEAISGENVASSDVTFGELMTVAEVVRGMGVAKAKKALEALVELQSTLLAK